MRIKRHTYLKIKHSLNTIRHITMDLLLVEIIIMTGIYIASIMI